MERNAVQTIKWQSAIKFLGCFASICNKQDACRVIVAFLDKIFDYVKTNKPCFYHCAIGADRTGTLSFMLEALLGVSSSDIDKDYEITSFHTGSGSQLRSRITTDYVGLVNQTKSVTIPSGVDDTLRNRCIYFLAQGAYADDVNSFSEKLNSFRKTMIDGTPEKITIKT